MLPANGPNVSVVRTSALIDRTGRIGAAASLSSLQAPSAMQAVTNNQARLSLMA
jgi:hypothetical protein